MAEARLTGPDKYELDVYFQKPSAAFASGYEIEEVSIPAEHRNEKICSLYHYPENDPQSRKAIFRQKLSSEKVSVVFFRRSTEVLELRCDNQVVSRKTLKPDFSG